MTGGAYDTMLTIIITLLSGGLITAAVTWLLNRHKPRIERDAAVDAQKRTAVEMADTVAVRALSLSERLEARMDDLEEEVIQLRPLRHVVEAWQAWGADLHRRWPWWRQQDAPPPLPDITRSR